ncbi:MAG: Fic family protein [Psychromonas sp.]
MWIWSEQSWPNFTWQSALVNPLLRKVQLNQGILLGKMATVGADPKSIELDTLLANILNSSAIEGEHLNAFSVRSSLANKLGVSESQQYPTSASSDGIAAMMIDAIHDLDSPLTLERIYQWHQWLFTESESAYNKIRIGALRGSEPMQVVSGRIDRPTVHFEAPPREVLEGELNQFIDWFNESRNDPVLDPLVRAAICHLWFVTLHPLDDGNGRITRALTDLALAQGEKQSIRLYAMSVGILKQRKSYYDILEQTQKSTIDITSFIVWFLDTLNLTILDVLDEMEQTISKTRFWTIHRDVKLREEQKKVLNQLLDGDFELGINASQYQKVAKVSRATATRHLAFLVENSCLQKTEAGGRSTRYVINK